MPALPANDGKSPIVDHTTLEPMVHTLTRIDPALRAIHTRFGDPPLWRREPGFATMVLFILEQQVSLASARSTFDKLSNRIETVSPETILKLDSDALRAVGFSRQKTRYTRSLAERVLDGSFSFDALPDSSDSNARSALMSLTGVGAWTAEVYLLMVLGRADAWPIGDLALRIALREVKELDAELEPPRMADSRMADSRMADSRMTEIAAPWRPYRGVATRLLWHYYLSTPRRRRATISE